MTPDRPILLDVSRLVWRGWGGRLPTGIDRTCLAYAAHYADCARAVVQRSGFRRILPLWLSRWLFHTLVRQEGVARRLALSAILTIAFYLPVAHRVRGSLYLNIGHSGISRVAYRRWAVASGVRPVYFVHDLIPITHPQYCRAGEEAKHRLRIRHVLDTAAGVVVNSVATAVELARFAETEGLAAPARTLVAPLGIEADFLEDAAPPPADTAVPQQPYFLVIGTIEGRKNHVMLLRLWRDLAAELGEGCPRLVIIGQRGWCAEEALALLDGCAELKPHVTEMARCGDAELAALLRGARALLFPSFTEGYGLPLVEALALGTPVIASNLPVFREIAGDLVRYCEADDVGAWRAAVRDFMNPASPERQLWADRIAASAYVAPSWSAHFARLTPWLGDVAASSA